MNGAAASGPGDGGRSVRGRVVARPSGGRSVVATAWAESPLRILQPRPTAEARAAAVCLVTFGGGLVDGDAIAVDLTVEAGATLLAFTQSSTKVFRGASRQDLVARTDGTLVLLPDPVAAFADAGYRQRVDVTLGPCGALVALDGLTSGRAAFGERWAMRSLDLGTIVRRHDGAVVVDDALRLDATDGAIAARLGGYDALLTLIAVGQGARPIAEAILRTPIAPPTADLFEAASPLPRADDGALLRVAGRTPSLALAAVRRRLGNLPEMGVVDPFASRR